MVPASHLLAFAGLSAVVIAVPGPSVMFTISRALSHGRRVAVWNVVGNAAGLAVQVVAVAIGVGSAVERSVDAFRAVELAGAAYLVYLGVQAVRHRRSFADAVARRVRPLQPPAALRDGFVVGVSNPKTIAVLVAVLPQFAAPARGDLPGQLLVLGLVFPLIALVLDTVWAVGAGTASAWLARSPRRLAAVGGAGGLAMIGAGLTLAATRRRG